MYIYLLDLWDYLAFCMDLHHFVGSNRGNFHRGCIRGDVKIPTYKPHTNHKKPSVSSHTLAPTTICDLSHSLCWSPLTDLGHISSVTYNCHPLWFVCGHRIPLIPIKYFRTTHIMDKTKADGSFDIQIINADLCQVKTNVN